MYTEAQWTAPHCKGVFKMDTCIIMMYSCMWIALCHMHVKS